MLLSQIKIQFLFLFFEKIHQLCHFLPEEWCEGSLNKTGVQRRVVGLILSGPACVLWMAASAVCIIFAVVFLTDFK